MTSRTSFTSRVLNAKRFVDELQGTANNYYLAIGKCDAWSTTARDFNDNNSIFDLTDGPQRTFAYEQQIRSNIMSLKKLEASKATHAIKKYVWNGTNGGINNNFVAWDSTDKDIFMKAFYVLVDDVNVYKCIRAGASSATVKPTHTTSAPVLGSDGYMWKYMYSLGASQVTFVTAEYIPIKTVRLASGQVVGDLGPSDQAQYNSQVASATDKGKIYNVKITNGGSGYTSAPTVVVDGDGTGFVATSTITNGSVTAITITNVGSNYNVCSLRLTGGGGTGATIVPILSPKGGHGTDPVSELFGNYVSVQFRVVGTESGKFIVGNDFRQFSIMRNPTLYNSSTLATADALNAIRYIDIANLTGGGNALDSLAVGVTSGASAYVATLDTTNGVIGVKQNEKTGYKFFQDGENLNFFKDLSGSAIATASVTSITASPAVLPDVDIFSGDLIITDNVTATTRSNLSEEIFTIILQY